MQRLKGMLSVSYTAITKRLKSITPESIDFKIGREFRCRSAYQIIFPKGMKAFDVTSYSVSVNHRDWVVTGQSCGKTRFLFVMDNSSCNYRRFIKFE